MKRTWQRVLAVALVLALGISGVAWWRPVAADTSCPVQLTTPVQNQVTNVSANADFKAIANATGSSVTNIGSVMFMLDGNNLGAGSVGNNGTEWDFTISRTQLSPGSHTVGAVANLSGGTACPAGNGTLNVQPTNSGSTSLQIEVSPASLDQPTYFPQTFTAHAGLMVNGVGQDVTAATLFQWMPTLGYITSGGTSGSNTISFNTGPTPGSGKITVTASYQSYTATTSINLNIFSPTTAPNPSGTPGSGNTGSSSGSTTSGTPNANPDASGQGSGSPVTAQTVTNPDHTPLPPITNPVDFLQIHDTALYTCIAKAVGADQLKQLQQTEQRLPFDDVVKSQNCLTAKSDMVPTYLAPVDPTKITTLPVTPKAAVSQVSTASATATEGIVLSGTAAPNSTVLVYVFSEPLVLVTQTDSNGKWTYTLQDPLEPGNHQAYVTVAGDNAQPVRSDVFGFAIAAAPKTANNPLGLSFAVEKKNPDIYYSLYVGAALALVILAGGAVLIVIRRHRLHTPTLASPAGLQTVTPSPSIAPSPIEHPDQAEGKPDVQG